MCMWSGRLVMFALAKKNSTFTKAPGRIRNAMVIMKGNEQAQTETDVERSERAKAAVLAQLCYFKTPYALVSYRRASRFSVVTRLRPTPPELSPPILNTHLDGLEVPKNNSDAQNKP